MQNKITRKIIIDKHKLDVLMRLGCAESTIMSHIIGGEPLKTGDALTDEILESLVDYKEFDNWGGTRQGAGRPKKNQLENQDAKINLKIKMNKLEKNQLENQDAIQVVDKDKDKDKDIKDSKGGMGEKKGNAVDEFGQKVKSLWNDVATKWKLEKIRVMTPARIRQTKDLLKQLDMSLEDFFGQLDYEIEVSPLLRGRTLADDGIWEDATWKCSFGFLVEPRQKKPTGGICIIEGRYRDPDIVRGLEKKKQMAIDAQKGERDGN